MSSPASPSALVPSEIVNREPDDADEDESPPMELLDAWKQVHERLTSAVLISQEAVAAKKLQRRYWMEEICANLTEDGKLTPSSVWKRAAPPSKKSAAKKMVSKKRKKAEPKQKKVAAKRKKVEKPPEQKTKETSAAEPKKKLTIRLKKPPVEPAPPPEEEEPIDQDDSQEASDEERNSDAEADTERTVSYSSEQQYNDSEGHESPPFGQGGPQWGPRQHDGYMVPNAYGSAQYPPYHPGMHDHHYPSHFYHPPAGMAPPMMGRQEVYQPPYPMPPPGRGRRSGDSSSEDD